LENLGIIGKEIKQAGPPELYQPAACYWTEAQCRAPKCPSAKATMCLGLTPHQVAAGIETDRRRTVADWRTPFHRPTCFAMPYCSMPRQNQVCSPHFDTAPLLLGHYIAIAGKPPRCTLEQPVWAHLFLKLLGLSTTCQAGPR
jgi:hypothetical protein